MTQITDNAEGKFELWFFRDMNDAQRLKLFSLFGLPTDEISTLGAQKLVLRRILSALISSPGKDGGQEPVGTGVFENGEMVGFIGLGDEFNPDPERPRDTRPIFTAPQPASTALVEKIVAAWEALPGGMNYSPKVVESWLSHHMAPAIAECRSALSASQSTSGEGER